MISKLIRRTHMYLALFLAPWLLIYAASTFVMNHRAWFMRAGGETPVFEKIGEHVYSKPLPVDATPNEIGAQVLRELGLDGAHNVNASPDGQRLTILRNDAIAPQRVTYTKTDNRVVIEKQVFRMPAFLERMHRRRGFQQPYALEDTWAFSVDLVIVALVFWSLSGLWLWWELKRTRKLGFGSLAAGCLLFTIFLFTI